MIHFRRRVRAPAGDDPHSGPPEAGARDYAGHFAAVFETSLDWAGRETLIDLERVIQ